MRADRTVEMPLRRREEDAAFRLAPERAGRGDHRGAFGDARGCPLHEGDGDWREVEPEGPDELTSIDVVGHDRSEEHTSELQSLMRISYAVVCLRKTQKQR